MAIRKLHDDDKVQKSLGLRGQAPWLVNESGIYALVMRSNKSDARDFQRWVTKEVLPSIRRNGGYMTPEVAQQAIDDPNAKSRAGIAEPEC
ncbi:putative phage-encoded protein [Variovorax sp. PBL-E5]|nr:putative phage-encoded protein [Variovorax sp. PBL-E5]